MAGPAALLAGPPGATVDLMRLTLRRNRATLSALGIDARPVAAPAEPGAEARLIVLDHPAADRLRALRDAIAADGPPRVFFYVAPPAAALTERATRLLLRGVPFDAPRQRPAPIGYREALERYLNVFGGDAVAVRIAAAATLPAALALEDLWDAAGLPGDPGDLRVNAPRPLSVESAAVIDRLLTRFPRLMDPTREPAVAAAARANALGIGGRPFALPADRLAEALALSRDDIAFLAGIVGADALAEPRPQPAEPAWAFDDDALDGLAALVMRAARDRVELNALGAEG